MKSGSTRDNWPLKFSLVRSFTAVKSSIKSSTSSLSKARVQAQKESVLKGALLSDCAERTLIPTESSICQNACSGSRTYKGQLAAADPPR